MTITKKLLPLFALVVLFLAVGCGKDDDTEPDTTTIDCTGSDPSYANDIKAIIDNTCAIAGCHVSGFASGDFTTYEGLKEGVDSGEVKARAVVDKDMPPSSTTGPASLTDNEIKLINCWIADGAPDN